MYVNESSTLSEIFFVKGQQMRTTSAEKAKILK